MARNFIGLAGAAGGLLTVFPERLLAGGKTGPGQFGKLPDQGELSADVDFVGF